MSEELTAAGSMLSCRIYEPIIIATLPYLDPSLKLKVQLYIPGNIFVI